MRIVLVLLLGAMLSACNLLQSRPGEAFDRIGNEMKEAAESKRRSPADDAVGRAMMPPVQAAEAIPAKPEPRFNLAVNNAPAGQVFMALVAGTRYSMLFPPELSGALTLNLKDVTVREALDAIRELYGYEYKIAGNRITIQTNSLQSRIYQLNYLASRRQGMTDMRVTSSSPSVVNPSGSSGGSSGSNTSNTTPQAAAAATARSLRGSWRTSSHCCMATGSWLASAAVSACSSRRRSRGAPASAGRAAATRRSGPPRPGCGSPSGWPSSHSW